MYYKFKGTVINSSRPPIYDVGAINIEYKMIKKGLFRNENHLLIITFKADPNWNHKYSTIQHDETLKYDTRDAALTELNDFLHVQAKLQTYSCKMFNEILQ
jgi:hypothetical protein